MTSPLPELTHITLESLAYRVKKMNQNAVLKEELWTRTQEQQRRELVIVERLKEYRQTLSQIILHDIPNEPLILNIRKKRAYRLREKIDESIDELERIK
jgi:hypothetical protein